MTAELKFFQDAKSADSSGEAKLNDLCDATEKNLRTIAHTTGGLTRSLENKQGVAPDYLKNYQEIEVAIGQALERLQALKDSLSAVHEESILRNR